MIGTLINAGTVLAGGTIGLLLKKNMPERITTIYFQAVGLFTMAIGISMVYKMQHILIVVSSLAIGSLLGEWMNLEGGAERLSNYFKRRLKIGSDKFSEGLTTAFLLFCIGSMTILGAIQEGTGGSPVLLMTKSLMDGFSAILLASAFGVGVLVSAIPLLIFQGGITLLAMYAGSFFTSEIIQGLTSVGGILNMLPALIIVAFLIWLILKMRLSTVYI